MNPELPIILFTVNIGFLVILLAGAVWSVAFPAKRAWPPPQRRSWQYVLTWASYDAVCGLSTALLFLDWNSWAFASPLRFIVGVPLALLRGDACGVGHGHGWLEEHVRAAGRVRVLRTLPVHQEPAVHG